MVDILILWFSSFSFANKDFSVNFLTKNNHLNLLMLQYSYTQVFFLFIAY